MKTRILLLLSVVICTAAAWAQFSTRTDKWKEVKQLEEKSLPKSAMEKVNQIYMEALAEKNSPEVIKALLHQLKYDAAIDKDLIPEKIKAIESLAAGDADKVEQSMLYGILGQLYNQYFQANQYSISRRTSVEGYVPENIREWSSNHFTDRITECVLKSLAADKELQATDVKRYQEILKQNDGTDCGWNLSLYDFLAEQGLNLFSARQWEQVYPAEQTDSIFDQWIAFRRSAGNPEALLFTELKQLDLIQNTERKQEYIDSLMQVYAGTELSVELIYRKAELMLSQLHLDDFEEEESEEEDQQQLNDRLGEIYRLCEEGIKQYPNYKRVGLLENFKNQRIAPFVNATSDNTVYPGKALNLKIKYRNVDTLNIDIYRINRPIGVYANNWDMKGQYSKAGKLVSSNRFVVSNELPYASQDTVLSVVLKEPGNYEYVIYSTKDPKEKINQQFSVSRLAVVSRAYSLQHDFLVTDRLSGKPIAGAQVNLYKKVKNTRTVAKVLQTDKNGLATISLPQNHDYAGYNASLKEDSALMISSIYWTSEYKEYSNTGAQIDLFTDRGIYRPGQTVFFKAIVYQSTKKKKEVVANKKYTVVLRDANYRDVSKQTLQTNEYGSLAGEFILPQGGLSGGYSLYINESGQSTYFRVEEYKRPTFDITFLPNTRTFHFGDTVSLQGNARSFSGVSIQEMPLQFRVIKRSHWLWRSFYMPEEQVANGTVHTDNEGNFEVRFPAERGDSNRKEDLYYRYEVQVSLTDAKGETQESSTSVSIGDKSMYLQINKWEGNVDKQQLPELIIQGYNLDGQKIDGKGTYQVYRLAGKEPALLASGEFVSGQAVDVASFAQSASGKYRFNVQSKDDRGREVSLEQDFVLYSVDDKQPPVFQHTWLLTPKTTCALGENAEIVFGSSLKDVYVLYELFKDGKKLQTGRFELSNSNRKMEIPFLPSYGDGIAVSFVFIKEGKLYSETISIQKKQEDKTLKLQTEVFRDKLLPGQKEEWKLSVKDAQQQPVQAELLAGMYDASLDKISPFQWDFYPGGYSSSWTPNPMRGESFSTRDGWLQVETKSVKIPACLSHSYNWFGLDMYGAMMRNMTEMKAGRIAKGEENKVMAFSVAESSSADYAELLRPMLKETIKFTPPGVAADETGVVDENSSAPVQVRRNFNETAFLYPQLRTNEEGETLISFTVPESNTTWKFQALAHTKDLKFGSLIKEAISQKKLMVSPNMPRFIREGDKASLSALISNLSDQDLSGNVKIEFFDPETQHTVLVAENANPDFSVERGRTISVDWKFVVPSGIELVACRIIARTDDFSDGEQHLLPVLPNRMMVTESLPLSVSGKETKTYTLDKLVKSNSPTIENYRLTLEFAGNPTWYAVQALPAMVAPSGDDVIAWFAAYYSNALATQIANSTPKIKQVIEAWTKQGKTKETLVSNLEKNQDLKAVLLEETPWVMEAKDETEQKQGLSLLFDLNRAANLSLSAEQKLKELQTSEGGWAWFKGMNPSVSMTQWLLYGMGELARMQALKPSSSMTEMQAKALSFIDRKMEDNFKNLKKYNKDWEKKTTISTYELEYLLVRAYYKEIPLTNAKEAAAFYTNIAEKNWTKIPDLYSRSIAALIMQRNGKTETAQAIVRSLREHATNKADQGMYWANNHSAYSFVFQSATTVHTFMMQAFRETGAPEKEMNALKLWLLCQKQTQLWETTPATVNAVAVLLTTGDNWLESSEPVSIHLGDTKIENTGAEIGTGYIKQVFESKEIQPAMGKVSLSKTDKGPAWGALYWQYFEDLDKITQAKTGLHVEKKLFIEKTAASGKILEPLASSSSLSVGDKVVVRLTLRCERDVEYVLLKDMRASCFEPVDQVSGTRRREGLVYYQSPKDASTNFYFDHLPKGTYVFEYGLYVNRTGDYSNGITTVQCLYAPEFISHTAGGRVVVE